MSLRLGPGLGIGFNNEMDDAASGVSDPSTIFTPSGGALNANTVLASTSFREQVTLAVDLRSQIRILIKASTAGVLLASRISFGKWTGEADESNTTATPVEFKFGGGFSGVNLGAGSSSTSDWISTAGISATAGDRLIIILDVGVNGNHRTRSTNTNCQTKTKASATTWNVADVTGQGFSAWADVCYSIEQIETR